MAITRCFDGLTGDLLKAELRDGPQYCSKKADQFMIPLMREYQTKYPSLPLYLRGDSGFASPELYGACEEHDCKYAIRLKDNKKLRAYAADVEEALYRATIHNQTDHAVEYGEFQYQSLSWSQPRRVVFKVEKPENQLIHMFTFIVTAMEMEPYQVIQFYCGRGKTENSIKECKSDFGFEAVSNYSKAVDVNRLHLYMLSYNPINWFRHLVLPTNMRKQQIATICLKLLKIATKAVHSTRYITFKLSSSCPYKKEFYATLKTSGDCVRSLNSHVMAQVHFDNLKHCGPRTDRTTMPCG